MTGRGIAKRGLERLVCLGVGQSRRMRGRSLILAYHNVVPDHAAGLGDRSLHLPLGTFLRQLALIADHCNVVTLTELLAGAIHPDRPNVAITFDDAYRGALELGLPAILQQGLTATLFVSPGLFGAPHFWWDDLADAQGRLAPELRATILDAGGALPRSLAWRPESASETKALPPQYACAEEGQVLAAGAHSGIALGAHTWSHPNLARLSSDELELELSRPIAWLNGAGVSAVSVLAYPFGLYTRAVQAAVEEAGYSAALCVSGGWLPRQPFDPWAVPRYNVPAGISDDGFRLRLAGLFAR